MVETNILPAAAMNYLNAGLCVLPAIRAEKRPAAGRWKQYQTTRPTDAELSAWFQKQRDAVCILCGAASGNGEIIDFDAGGELFDAWCKAIPAELLRRLVIESTPSGGWHVIYRCECEICGNLKLAQRKDAEKIVTLIETRGEGGLFLCAPTAGYKITQGDLCNLPRLTENERDVLLQAALDLNEYLPPAVNGPTNNGALGQRTASSVEQCQMSAENSHNGDSLAHNSHNGQFSADNSNNASFSDHNAERPGDDFNIRGDVRAVLEQFGWSLARGGENEYWRRPGKSSGWSATLKERVFYVFSSNAAPFEPNTAYSPFSVYALLNHSGEYELAARHLRLLGFGGHCLADSANLPAFVESSGDGSTENDDSGQTTALCDGRAEIPDPGQMPAEMLRIPGFISEVMDHTLAVAPYPSQVMAFGGAMALQAFLAGRRVRDPGDNRTNLYLLGLAHSGAGKDQSRKVNCDIIHAVGLGDGLGLHFASGEGLQDALYLTPSMLFQTDEIDGMLQSINKAKDARHEAIMSTLLTMYSSANSVFPMRRKAGKESPGVIDQPCLVIYGTAIPNHYYEALSERMLTNGFFARMIILEAGSRGEARRQAKLNKQQQVHLLRLIALKKRLEEVSSSPAGAAPGAAVTGASPDGTPGMLGLESDADALKKIQSETDRWQREAHRQKLQAIEDEHLREMALLNERYQTEIENAKKLGSETETKDLVSAINNARLAERNRLLDEYVRKKMEEKAAQREAADKERTNIDDARHADIEEMELRSKYKGVELEKKLLKLEEQRATLEARRTGASLILIMKQFALKRKLLDMNAGDALKKQTEVRGTFNAAALQGLQGGDSTQKKIADAAEETKKDIKKLTKFVVDQRGVTQTWS